MREKEKRTMYSLITKFRFTLALCLVLIGYQLNAQYFFKSYDLPPFGSRTEYGYSIERNFDGTVAGRWSIAGVSNSTPNAGSFDWMFLKLSNTGTVSCATLLGFSLADSCFSHIQLGAAPRRNVLAGFYRAPNSREKASFTMLDTMCFPFVSKQIADTLRHEYRQVVKNTADMFTMAGYIETYISSGTYQKHILASQYTPAGALAWAYNYMPPFPWVDERAYSVTFQPTDGSYAITGITNRFTGPGGAYQVFIMKISAAGIPIWYKGYSPIPGAPSDAKKIIAMPDGGFVVTGNTTAFDPLGDIYVVRVTSTGAVVWQVSYGMPGVLEQSRSIIYHAADMSLVFTGSAAPGASTEDVILSKITSAAGAPVWTKRYPNTAGIDRGYDLKETPSPVGFAVTGKFFNGANDDPFFLKTDASGIVTAACQDSTMLQPRTGQWTDSCARTIIQLSDITIQPQFVNPITAERNICGSLTGVNGNSEVPESFMLKQNYPNPFNPSTVIMFSTPVDGNVSLTVYDITGKEVTKLVNGYKPKGNYTVNFEGSDLSGGVYFYELKTDGFTETKKMLMVK